MNRQHIRKFKTSLIGLAFFFGPNAANFAALTDLADAPVTTLSTTNVLPNIMFTLDDSGSMQQDYTPDYVNDTMCYDNMDGDNTINNTLKPCFPGDPLFMSPDFNSQYYNPEIYYQPPVDSGGLPYDRSYDPNGNANPGAAKTDPYGVQKKDMLQNAVTTVNLKAKSWPDREWCNGSSGGTACVTNTNATGYKYPDASYGYGYGKSGCKNYDTFYGSGSKCINYVYDYPYYWKIEPNEYCSDEELKSCSSTITSFPAKVRWCTSSNLSDCQARKFSGYDYLRTVGQVSGGASGTSGVVAIYRITFSGVPKNTGYTISNIKITAGSTTYTLLSSLSNTTAGSSQDNQLASKVAGAISSPDFSATATSNYVTITSKTISGNNYAIYNGKPSLTFSLGSSKYTFSQTQTGTNSTTATPGTRVKNYPLKRVDIISGNTYKKYDNRTDCAGSVCTYDEEIQNFANWFSYYRTRMQSMKTAVSIAFKPIDSKFRVGYNTISFTGTSNSDARFLSISDFAGSQKSSWYSKLFGATVVASTPLRTSLKKVGDIFAGVYPSVDPIQYSCQQNFTILTTDGYWNDSFSFTNQDNDPTDGYSTRSSGSFDGGSTTNAVGTLADVAMYYYKTDLRPLMKNNVFQENAADPNADNATHQHMTTFTLGLGVNGVLRYQKDYDTSASGDFAQLKNSAATGCAWDSNCNWPVPASNSLTAVDDLWHAAVNGRGKYFSAKDPGELVLGLKDALGSIGAKLGSASAGATSTPFITTGDNSLYITTFLPDPGNDDWQGEVRAKRLDPVTGQVISSATDDWVANTLLTARVSTTSDTRTIYTFNGGGAAPKSFDYSVLGAQQAYFDNKGSYLGQYSSLGATDQSKLNSGSNLVNYLRGQTDGVGAIYRKRQVALGDTVHSKPVFVKAPTTNYNDSGYATFKSTAPVSTRSGVLYVGANDGMIHAFNGTDGNTSNGVDGDERWAYVPKMLMPNMYKLAEKFYYSSHLFFVDGEQTVGDAKYFGSAKWATLLVTGMGKGARGFVALDVTNPDTPIPMWEFCHDSSLCAISDADLGYSFGNPVITKRAYDGRWVVIVTSGYNNVSPGDGRGYLYVLDAENGQILSKTSTGSGSSTSPSGLGRINVWVTDPQLDNTGQYVYGGDLNGDLWRFDLTQSTVSVINIGTAKDGSGKSQPITTKPELVDCYGSKMVLLGTGKLLGTSDLTTTDTQTVYGVKDRGTPYASGSLRLAPLVQQTTTAVGDDVQVSNNVVNASDNGWYLDLSAGERVNVDPFVALGSFAFASNIPNSSDPCAAGGESIFYTISACSGGVINPSVLSGYRNKNAMIAGITGIQTSTGVKAVIQDTLAGTTVRDVPTNSAAAGGKRVTWRELVQ